MDQGILPKDIANYVALHTSAPSEVLEQLDRDTQAKVLRSRMLSGGMQGRLLSFISKMMRPRRILELGTYTGYSAICLAEGLTPDGRLHTIEHNPELEDFAKKYIQMAGFGDQIIQHIGEALEVIPTLEETFDLVFLDADKENYVNYFELLLPKIRTGGILLADNVLWSGQVLNPPDNPDRDLLGIVRFNEYILGQKGIKHLMLPLRDGIMMVEKSEDLPGVHSKFQTHRQG